MADALVIFRVHAIQQMFTRGILETDVRSVLEDGQTIEEYPDQEPYANRLLLGWVDKRALHVVAAFDEERHIIFVVTAYWPDLSRWMPGFRARREV